MLSCLFNSLIYRSHIILRLTSLSLLHQTGVQDYETFNDQLESLGSWIVEAEEGLKVQDPNGSTDLTVIQDRMEDLKVCFVIFIRTNQRHSNQFTFG